MIKNLDSIKSKIDIVEIISDYLPLKKVGSNYQACCPFHNEKSPSFVVSPQKQIFHCFGCNESGDAISFLQKFKQVDFLQALDLIASSAGLTLEIESNQKAKENKDFYKRAVELNETLKDIYTQSLENNEQIQTYLLKRGLNLESAKKYELGFSPSGQEIAMKLNAEQTELAFNLGILAKSKTGQIYAPLAHRIIFCLRDNNYKLVGFSGRAQPYYNFRNAGKYINSKESKIFKKSSVLYRLSHTKNAIAKARAVYIVEGFMDALALDLMGISNAVATAGVAFSVSHLSALNKLKDIDLIFAFDKDEAGGNATARALELCFSNNIYNVKVAWAKNAAKDFGEVLQKGETLDLQEMNGFKFYLKFKFKHAKSNKDKEAILVAARNIINQCPFYYERQDLIKIASEALHLNENILSLPTQSKTQPMPSNATLESNILKNALENADFAYLLKSEVSQDKASAFNVLQKDFLAFLHSQESSNLNALLVNENLHTCKDMQEFSELIRALLIKHTQKELTQAKQAKNHALIMHLRKELDLLQIPF